MSARRPRLAEVLEGQRLEAERQQALDQYRDGLQREIELLDAKLGELRGPEPERPPEDAAAAFKRRAALAARREEEEARAANVAAHLDPDPPRFDPIVELLERKRGSRQRLRRRFLESARRGQ